MNNYRRVRGFEHVSVNHMKNDYMNISSPQLPKRSDDRSAGHDIYSPISFTIPPMGEYFVWLDIKSYMLADEFLSLHMRSSHGKLGLRFANTTGIVDASYYGNESNDGNIGIHFVNTSDKKVHFQQGERIAQGIFQKYLVADNDEPTSNTRLGGYGSSGR